MRCRRFHRSLPILSVLLLAAFALGADRPAVSAEGGGDIPQWLQSHVGEGSGQIALPVLLRARSLYQRSVAAGTVRNPCYFAMDATRPNSPGDGRFYVICEGRQSFRALSSGHGGGRALPGVGDFSNGRRCARNFGNALDSSLTAGGPYVTRELKTSFKGYVRASAGQDTPFMRTFVQFDGQGEAANSRVREIGGHAAVVMKGMCRRRQPSSPYADKDGYVAFGAPTDYAGGRSNGCTTWTRADAQQLIPMVDGKPTSLYIYPESADIAAVAAGRPRAGAYWNASCLKEIGTPRFWSRQKLEPLITRYEAAHPPPPPQPLPICATP